MLHFLQPICLGKVLVSAEQALPCLALKFGDFSTGFAGKFSSGV